MSGWFLDAIEIEGFRGINNEGDPLCLSFKDNAVCSISAPNGVGKSSIFDAISFALRSSIPKLDGLPSSEGASGYYINRFHTGGVGTIKVTLTPDGGGSPISILVKREADGSRTVSAPAGTDAEAIFRSLDREFVLLDHQTFQTFIGERDLDRGRSFSGLLGLKRHSDLRQELQALANTRAFNNQFATSSLDRDAAGAEGNVRRYTRTVETAFQTLTETGLSDHPTEQTARDAAHGALAQIELLKPHCIGQSFDGIDLDGCLTTIKQAEGGEDRARLSELIREQTSLETTLADGLTDADYEHLKGLASSRDTALAEIGTALLRRHYQVADEVLADASWIDKNLCPTCETRNDSSVLDTVRANLASYDAARELTEQIAATWTEKNWSSLSGLETLGRTGDEPTTISEISRRLAEHSLTAQDVGAVWQRRSELRTRLNQRLQTVQTQRQEIERKLPPSLVEVTTRVETARRLRENRSLKRSAEQELARIRSHRSQIDRVKRFLDTAAGSYAAAESRASERRLAAVLPLCRTFFAAIVHDPVEPALVKPPGGEALSLSLAKFWTLENVSAQALLAESFRNAFAVSVYLAAAKLYGGDARFMVLDDVTSSFDAGHQFHLMEVIRTQFARPGQPDGPQVILLSHDTLLEKLFNKNANSPDWQHIRLEGTARTAVLPQSNAGNRVRDATVRFLTAGQVEDGALRLRQYLEYKLLEIISRVNIPVPVDFALDDTKKQVQAALDAIQRAVDLHRQAGNLVLSPQQQAGLQTHVASITGNFLSHYATGSTQAFSGSSLLGVVNAIDAYAECFTFEDPPGSGNRRYCGSLSR
jgi:hypothetical protein